MTSAELKKDTFFAQYGTVYSTQHSVSNTPIPFKDHYQFPILVDILSRKNCHHSLLCADMSIKTKRSYLQAFLKYLTNKHVPHPLRDAELIYLNLESVSIDKAMQKIIEEDICSICDVLDASEKYQLIALPSTQLLKSKNNHEFLRKQLSVLLHHPKCRFIIFANRAEQYESVLSDQFSFLYITPPNESDVIMLLKYERLAIENFHHVVIPEELLANAYALAERYLSAEDTLSNALLLLDSAAARESSGELVDIQNKPIVTMNMLTRVLSDWTHIPDSHLTVHKFNLGKFQQSMQERIFGQDAAITIIGQELQQANARLHLKSGPFCSFLFAGCAHSGKKAMASTLVEQLFNQPTMFYYAKHISASQSLDSLIDITLERSTDRSYALLKEVIRQTPYAVIMFEDIELANPIIMNGLYEMLTTGLLHSLDGHEYNFRQAMIILSTQLGQNKLNEIAQVLEVDKEANAINLMQLVMSIQKPQEPIHQHYSPQDLVNEIIPDILDQLPPSFCRHLRIVPFFPPKKSSIEKIIHLQIKQLAKQLDTHYGIQLNYAAEVIHFLADEVLLKQKPSSINKVIKQVYFCVEQAILSQLDNKARSNQLILQLNETGQVLRCDWSIASFRVTAQT